ncbi:prolyl oligopeptidase family serine peptidase [Granulicella cerasi]|uniref:prolyl oligopeptidase n=1 Tax=Granulicella cerasi TaxID=741063 RepID=A0ABW1ZG10_9BACT|nr:prolyl oligopeptidase family serine peptidase [Granulicella cerasi]
MIEDGIEEMLHGVAVKDPYQWLEDRNSTETQAWIDQQQLPLADYFRQIGVPETITLRVSQELGNVMIDQVVRCGDQYIYRKRFRAGEHRCLCISDASGDNEKILVDPQTLGPYQSVSLYRVSSDGRFVAYEVIQGGSDKRTVRVINLLDGDQNLATIDLGYPRGLAFTAEGFFFSQETTASSDVYRICHRRFDAPGEDRTVFEIPRSECSRILLLSDDHRLGVMVIRFHDGESYIDLWVATIDAQPKWSLLAHARKVPFSPILANGQIYAVVGDGVACTRVVSLSENGSELNTIVPSLDSSLNRVTITTQGIFVGSSYGLDSIFEGWSFDGHRTTVLRFPNATLLLLSSFCAAPSTLLFSLESFESASLVYEYSNGQSVLVPNQRVTDEEPSALWTVKQDSVASRDGTSFAVSVISKRDANLSQRTPAIMTSYGGFGRSMTPMYSVFVKLLVEMGAVFVIPHIRGGGEEGAAWHEAGRGTKRQNTFDDFLCAAEWLRNERICDPNRLAIFGGSNSGLLVAAAMTQRPDLFCAVLCIAPLLDMVRYERFDRAANWRSEYGTIDIAEEFHALHAYSPYHRVSATQNYPACLFVTGDRDDRCNPAHVRKMAALMQGRKCQSNPVLVDYSLERGHAGSLPLSVKVDALTRRIAFLCHELGIDMLRGGSDETLRA